MSNGSVEIQLTMLCQLQIQVKLSKEQVTIKLARTSDVLRDLQIHTSSKSLHLRPWVGLEAAQLPRHAQMTLSLCTNPK